MTEDGRLVIDVIGLPAPKGSGFRMANGGYRPGRNKEQSERITSWATAVSEAAAAEVERSGWQRLEGPCSIDVTFVMPALASDRYRTRHVSAPDLDKALRNTFDSLVAAGVIRDDSLVWSVAARKRHSLTGRTGAHIVVVDDAGREALDREDRKAEAAAARRGARQAALL